MTPVAPRPVHSLTLRETARISIDILPDGRVRLAVERRSPAGVDPNAFSVAAAIAFDVSQAREVVAGIRSAILQLEATAEVDG